MNDDAGRASDAERWDEKYRSGRWNEDPTCDAFVLQALELIGAADGRRALDLAAGAGRHALELAARGWRTSAWDVSREGLKLLAQRAAAAGLVVESRVIDLTSPLPTPAQPFDLVVLVNYLDRALHAKLADLLEPNGWLVYTTFTTEHGGTHPSARHCLDPGELAAGLPGFRTVQCDERGGRAFLVARRES